MDYSVLSRIESLKDLKKLNTNEISALCEEIRDCILTTVSKNGGHLASNLGAVELTVALHRVFDSPKDAIIFDVGHQCYAHKLLTGRLKDFDTLRQENGISGFMKPSESEHDSFITGHSSNSISAAYGIYKAKKLSGQEGTAVAVIGDGAMTGGMAYEALNNSGNKKGNFIVVFNDNEMSISKNVGSLSNTFTKMRNKAKYHRFKFAFSNFLLKIPFIGKILHKIFYFLKESVKGIVYKNNIFSSFGFNYLGPVDGHNVAALESLLKIAESYDKPTLVHVITKKGKGYSFAENEPHNYHGVSPFDVEKGVNSKVKMSFSKAAGDALCELAQDDEKICAITAAMTEGTGLCEFAEKYNSRFFDVGIAEQHAVTFAAGLAKGGMKPYFAVYSTFLQRGFDQLIHDIAIGNFPVRLLIDRAGIVGEDGETHQGIFDVSYLTLIPNIKIYSPSTYEELKFRIKESAKVDEICAIRYPRGSENTNAEFDYSKDFTAFESGSEKVIVTYGRLFGEALKAREKNNIDIIKLNKIYPVENELINALSKYSEIYFFEESVKNGSIAEHLLTKLNTIGFKGKYSINAIDNKFVPTAKVEASLKQNQLDFESMINITE